MENRQLYRDATSIDGIINALIDEVEEYEAKYINEVADNEKLREKIESLESKIYNLQNSD